MKKLFDEIVRRDLLQTLVLVGILIIVAVAIGVLSDRFFTATNIANISNQVAIVIIAGCALTLLMISGHLDLSVGSVLALASVLSAKFVSMGMPVPAAIFLTLVLSGSVGFFNGLIVSVLRVPSVIATLGTLFVVRGLAFIIVDGRTINTGLPSEFNWLGRSAFFGIPVPALVMLLVLLVFFGLQSRTLLGKYTYALGGNRQTAVLSGIGEKRVVLTLFVLSAVAAGLCGAITASRLGVGQPNVGVGFEFDVIIAVLLGGTAINGGRGSVIGTLIGALIVGILANGLNLMGIDSFYQYVLKGSVLLAAVGLDVAFQRRFTDAD